MFCQLVHGVKIMPINPTEKYLFEANGVMQGQTINSHFFYHCEGGTTQTLAEGLVLWQAAWRAQVVSRVSDEYSVLSYNISQIADVIWLSTSIPPVDPPVWPFVTPVFRYSDQASLAGTSGDVGDIVAAQTLPSFVVASFAKQCGQTTSPYFPYPFLPLEKRMRGGFGLSGITEDRTDVGNANRLNPASITSLGSAGSELRVLDFGAPQSMVMIVPSFVKDGQARWTGTPRGPAWAYARVNSILLSPYVSSRVSRKQTIGNLG